MLPNFLIVGAAKSGTTSLHKHLSGHPDVFMPETKEPSFFVAQEVQGRIPTWVSSEAAYDGLFQDATSSPLRGEASVLYLYYWQAAIPRILEKLGSETKIIIILRNPIDRALSAYYDSQRFDANENLDFEAALAAEESRLDDSRLSPMMHYQAMGLYYSMVSAYQRHFGQVHVILFENLIANEADELRRVARFLGIDPDELPGTAGAHMNAGGKHWDNPILGKLVKGIMTPGLRRFLSGIAPGAYSGLKKMVTGKLMTKAPGMSDQTREQLRSYFFEDVRQLREIVRCDFEQWSDFV